MAKKKAAMSLKDRLKAKRQQLKEGGGNRDITYIKADTTVRARILNVGEENEWYIEVIQFYLPGVKGVFSPATFGDECAIMEWYEELSQSSDKDDKALVAKVGMSRKYLVPVVIYTDDKGKHIDESRSGKLLQLTKGLLGETMDNFLDDEWGDFTDATEGYDIKYMREGSGKNDTVYSSNPCKPSKLAKPWSRKPVDLEEMVKKTIPSYEDTKNYLNQFLNGGSEEESADIEDLSRKELKAYIKDNDLDISVKKSMDDEDIVKKIKKAEKKNKKKDI